MRSYTAVPAPRPRKVSEVIFSQIFNAAMFAVLSLTVLVGLAITVETVTAKLRHRPSGRTSRTPPKDPTDRAKDRVQSCLDGPPDLWRR